MKNKPKAFLEALAVIHSDPRKGRRFLQDKRISQTEKKIITAWFLLKTCKHDEIFKLLNDVSAEGHPLVEGERKLILGITYNNCGYFHKAIDLITEACEVIDQFPLPKHHFTAISNLFVAHFNLENVSEMSNCLKSMERLLKSEFSIPKKIYLLQSQFEYYLTAGANDEASECMKEIDLHLSYMDDALIMSHFIAKFKFFIKTDQFTLAGSILEESKQYRLFRFSPNFTFMRLALKHFLKNESLYVYKKDFIGCELLYDQLMTIQGLEESDQEKALKHWNNLRATDPKTYGENFHFNGSKCLFSLCLNKHMAGVEDEVEKIESSENNIGTLINLLTKSKTPIKKDMLFKLIWGREAQNEADDTRFKNLISYARKERGFNIAFKKGCYFIESIKKGHVA